MNDSEKLTSDCPSFLKYWDDKKKECRYCKNEFRKEYISCKKATKKLEEKENMTVEVLPGVDFTKQKGQRMPLMIDWSFAQLTNGLPIEDLPKALYNAHMECGKTKWYARFRIKQIMAIVNEQWPEMKASLSDEVKASLKEKEIKKKKKKKKKRRKNKKKRKTGEVE